MQADADGQRARAEHAEAEAERRTGDLGLLRAEKLQQAEEHEAAMRGLELVKDGLEASSAAERCDRPVVAGHSLAEHAAWADLAGWMHQAVFHACAGVCSGASLVNLAFATALSPVACMY